MSDTYAAIAYYLQRIDEIDAYLADRQAEVEVLHRELEAHFAPSGIRNRLLARRNPPGTNDPLSG